MKEEIQTTVADVLCDGCGISCRGVCDYEYLSLSANWGYDSQLDGEQWNGQLCEKCSMKLLEIFPKISRKEVYFE